MESAETPSEAPQGEPKGYTATFPGPDDPTIQVITLRDNGNLNEWNVGDQVAVMWTVGDMSGEQELRVTRLFPANTYTDVLLESADVGGLDPDVA
jgi:hypothetical protein